MASEKRGVRVAVVGPKSFSDYDKMKQVLDTSLTENALLISGGAPGADSLVERYALETNRRIHVITADWEQHGPRAEFIRNQEIVDHASMIIAFHDGTSRGTKHTIELAKKQGIPVHIIPFKSKEQTKESAHYSDKPLTEKQQAFIHKYGSKDAIHSLESGDNRTARIHLEITFDKLTKERELNMPSARSRETTKSHSRSSGPER